MHEHTTGAQSRALHLQGSVLSHARLREAATALASELAALENCSRVSVGWVRGGPVALLAVSHGSDDDLQRPAFNPLTAAMDEAVQQGHSVCCPASDHLAVRLAHQALLAGRSGAVATVPVVARGQVVGAVTLEWAQPLADLGERVAGIEHHIALAGPVLHLMAERDQPWRQRWAARWRQHMAEPGRRRVAWAGGLALVLLTALLLLPVEHRVGGHARVQGEQQRSVVAPQDGFIDTVAVRPGDRIQRGQLLLALADQDLQLQQRRWSSELAQHENAYAASLTRADRAGMVIALARADEARAHLALIDAELQRARIASPMDGVVVEGDLSQSIGAPVERGRQLMVLAPLDRYRVAVRIDERDIARVQPGQRGQLALSALPWDVLPVKVQRITPLAQAVDGRNVFEVETDVAPGAAVRPGLEGVAKLVVGQAPLGWVLFHHSLQWLRLHAWRWWP
jgi:biotin carboxyl carrier protein